MNKYCKPILKFVDYILESKKQLIEEGFINIIVKNKENQMTKHKKLIAHIVALITMTIWGFTFISTKWALVELRPIEIMLYRFMMAYIALWIVSPKRYSAGGLKNNLIFLGMGLTGVSLYFSLENLALVYTTASNTGLILAIAPILTGIVAHLFTHDEKLNRWVFIGFLFAMSGVALVVFNGNVMLELNPKGDILAVLSALMWAFYSVLLKNSKFELPSIVVVRKTFFYGILSGFVILVFTQKPLTSFIEVSQFTQMNVIALGLLGSGLCYVLWNKVVAVIGPIKANNYIYLLPVITMISAKLFLNETINGLMITGSILIIFGVVLSDHGEKIVKIFLKKVA